MPLWSVNPTSCIHPFNSSLHPESLPLDVLLWPLLLAELLPPQFSYGIQSTTGPAQAKYEKRMLAMPHPLRDHRSNIPTPPTSTGTSLPVTPFLLFTHLVPHRRCVSVSPNLRPGFLPPSFHSRSCNPSTKLISTASLNLKHSVLAAETECPVQVRREDVVIIWGS